MNKTLSTMLSNTYTKMGLLRRLRLLRTYLEQSFFAKNSQSVKAFLKEKGESDSDIEAMDAWGAAFYKGFTQKGFYKAIDGLRKDVDSLPAVSLFVPFDAPEEEVEKLGKWCRDHVDKKAILDVRQEPSLGLGCAIAWNGMYRDFSLHHYLSKNKGAVMEVINSFDKGQHKRA